MRALGQGMARLGGRGGGREEQAFAAEVARLQASGALGDAGRLRELFDYLAARGPAGPRPPRPRSPTRCSASPTPKATTPPRASTSTACASGSRISTPPQGDGPGGARLTLPAGTYALRLAEPPARAKPAPPPRRCRQRWPYAAGARRRARRSRVLAGRLLPGRATRRPPTPSGSRSSNSTARSWSWSATTTCSARSTRSAPSRAA